MRGKKTAEVIKTIEALMKHETAGDPITGLKWTKRTTGKIADALRALEISISPNTVARLLKDLGYSLRVNHKNLSRTSDPNRDQQFCYIAELRERFSRGDAPIISVDTKKKEKVGNFKNDGVAWNKQSVQVNDHDFLSDAIGMAIPYGVYDLRANRGSVFIGWSHDTPEFAVSSISKWLRYDGRRRYPGAEELLILADGGGSNGSKPRAWKRELQALCDRQGVSITVCHYPPGTSKWNPIEHKMFSCISNNWAGRPLDSYETIKNYISTTTTSTGLKIKAYLDGKQYQEGVRVSNEEMELLNIERHETLPDWNYTLRPR